MKQYKNVSDVEKQYKFDLEDILQGKTFDYWIEEFKRHLELTLKNKDSKYDNLKNYAESFELGIRTGIISNKISNYINNYTNRELNNPQYKELENKVNQLVDDFNKNFGSETVRFFKNIDKVKSWLDSDELKPYRKLLDELIDEYDHKLDDNIEEYLTETSKANPNYEGVFTLLTDSEIDYGFVLDDKGKKHKLNPVTRRKYLKSDDKILRKNTVLQWNKSIVKHKESLANLLFQQFKTLNVEAKVRNYTSAVNMLTSKDKVDDELLQILFSKVQSLNKTIAKYRNAFKKFYELKFKEKYHPRYDSSRDLVKVKTEYTIEEMQQIVLDSLKPFGNEYYETVNKALKENWVDYMTIENKVSGAYSIGETYGIDKKYILMNFDGQFESVETLAHELGHSLHSYFSDKNNNFYDSQYPIFLAEIASIFNEEMLYDHLLKTNKNDKFKFQLVEKMIDGFIGVVQRQIIWANYEYNLYDAIDKYTVNESYDSISKLYFENLKKYTNKKLKYESNFLIDCVNVPHFYYGFYVYKYAIGQLVSNYFFSKYKKEGKEYLQYYISNFLSKGGSDYPLEILKNVGVDLKSDEFYQIGFSYFEELVDEYIKLGNKIFKK